MVRQDERPGQNLRIAGEAGGGLLDLAGAEVELGQKPVAAVHQPEGFRHRPVSLADFAGLWEIGLDPRVQQGRHTGFDLDHRQIELGLGQLESLFRLALLQAELDPDGGRVAGGLRQLLQESFGLFGVAGCDGQACQLDGGGLPVGRAAGAADFLQQRALAGPPAAASSFFLLEEELKTVIDRRSVELKGGAGRIAAEQFVELRFRRAGIPPHHGLHHRVDLRCDLLVGKLFLKLQQGIHIGAQRPRQRAEQGDVGVRAVGLPLADGRRRNAQLRGKLLLGHPPGLAQGGDLRADLHVYQWHRFSSFPVFSAAVWLWLYCSISARPPQARRG